MIPLCPGVFQLPGVPANAINVYLVEDVLIDTGTRWRFSQLLRQLRGRLPRLVALTHCHPDHLGSAHAICEHFKVPLACHEGDVPVMDGRSPMLPQSRLVRLADRLWSGPAHQVDQVLRDGDEVAGFRVIHAPGHTAGHVIFFRESDRVAIAGDVLANIHFLTWREGLVVPPRQFSVDARQNLQSIRLLAQLEPSLVCFGHGPPLVEPESLQRLAARIP
jgi:glyoxylase-like metal-dependent hydrolase (beta-lactamase superfamily II)